MVDRSRKAFIPPFSIKAMPNKITLLNDERIQYEGVFDLSELYKHAHSWLAWRKFDVEEKKYTEKLKAAGKEFEIKWEASKNLDEYSKFQLEIRFHLLGINEEQVKKDTHIAKMQKGEINIFVSAHLITDRQDYWGQSVTYSFLRGFYDRYIYRSSFERLKGELWKIGWDFFNEMKSFLNLYKFG